MMNREQTVEKLKTRLDQWNADIDTLEKKAEGFKADRREELQTAIRDLRRKRAEAREQFEKMKGASDDAFDDLKSGIEKGWDQISDSIEQAKRRYN